MLFTCRYCWRPLLGSAADCNCTVSLSLKYTHVQVIQVKGLLQAAKVDATETLAPQELHTLVGHHNVVLEHMTWEPRTSQRQSVMGCHLDHGLVVIAMQTPLSLPTAM